MLGTNSRAVWLSSWAPGSSSLRCRARTESSAPRTSGPRWRPGWLTSSGWSLRTASMTLGQRQMRSPRLKYCTIMAGTEPGPDPNIVEILYLDNEQCWSLVLLVLLSSQMSRIVLYCCWKNCHSWASNSMLPFIANMQCFISRANVPILYFTFLWQIIPQIKLFYSFS